MSRARTIAGLSLLGLADALYMLAYHEGWIDRMWCPFFGGGCETVGRSPEARHFGVPNAAVGAAGYAAMAAMALSEPRGTAIRGGPSSEPSRGAGPDWPALGLVAMSTGAAAASAVLTWEQGSRVRAWCFWCLLSAGINAAICALAWKDVSDAARPSARGETKGA